MAFTSKNEAQLERNIQTVHNWARAHATKVNEGKSGTMEIRADRRTRPNLRAAVGGIPIVQSYKYLGLMIDDCATVRLATKKIRDAEKAFRHKLNLTWLNKLSERHRWLIITAMLESRALYALYSI